MRTGSIFVVLLIVGLVAAGYIFQERVEQSARQHAAKDVYICPMHPQITSDSKGSCPICGMDLVKKEPAPAHEALSQADKKEHRGPADRQHAAKDVYICPMHPQIISDRKGSCPICGMDLVKKEPASPEGMDAEPERKERRILFYRNPMDPSVTSDSPTKDAMGMDYVPVYEEARGQVPGVTIDTSKQQLIGVRREAVQRRRLLVEISAVGRVAYDPDLYVAQEEYVQALKTRAASGSSPVASIREQAEGLLVSSQRKLLLMGMSQDEVKALEQSGSPQDSLYFPGSSGKAWVYVSVYEYEFGLVKPGQDVTVEAVAYPGRIFKGKVASLSPVLDTESRSLRVRVEVGDPDGDLKPEMYVNAGISVDLGERLAVPQEAVMDSGRRRIVYVVKDNRFLARDVTLGPKAGDYYEVLSGLEAGEEVVTSGNFLIDAESRIKGAL